MSDFDILPYNEKYRPDIIELLINRWMSVISMSRGKAVDASSLPGFIALRKKKIAGFATYHIEGDQCELVTLDSLYEGIGIGTALLISVIEADKLAGL